MDSNTKSQLEDRLERKLRNIEAMEARLLKLMAESDKTGFFLGTAQGTFFMNVLSNVFHTILGFLIAYLWPKCKDIMQRVLAWRSMPGNTSGRNQPSHERTVDCNDEVSDNHVLVEAIMNPRIISRERDEGLLHQKRAKSSRECREWTKTKGNGRSSSILPLHRPSMTTTPSSRSAKEHEDQLVTQQQVPSTHSSVATTLPQSLLCADSFAQIATSSTDKLCFTNHPQQISDDPLVQATVSPNKISAALHFPGDMKYLDESDIESKITHRMTVVRKDVGSKVFTGHFMMTADAPNMQEVCEHVARKATEIDENATLQLGEFAILYKAGEQIQTSELKGVHNVPIITSVTNFHRRALVVKGCYLSGTELKASTGNQCICLSVFKEIKHKDGLEAIFARIPEEPLGEDFLVYAYKTIHIGKQSLVVRSEGKPIETPALRQPTILGEVRATPTLFWIFIIFLSMIEVASFMPLHSLITAVGVQVIIAILSYCFVISTLGPWIVEIFIRWVAAYWRPCIAAYWRPCIVAADGHVKKVDTTKDDTMTRSKSVINDDDEDADDDTDSHGLFKDPSEHEGEAKTPVTDPNWLWPCFERQFELYRWQERRVANAQIKETEVVDWPFEVITEFRKDEPYSVGLRLRSAELTKIINQSNPELSHVFKGEVIKPQEIFFRREGLYKYVSSTTASDGQAATAWYVKHLLRFMEGHFKDTLLKYPNMKKEGRVSYDMLWAFLAPGVKVCYKCPISEQQCHGKVRYARYTDEPPTFQIQLDVMDYNVERYYQCHVKLSIGSFDEEVPFTSLKVCPMEFFADQQKVLKARFLEMGTQFYNVAMREPFRFMQFKGSLNFVEVRDSCPVVRKLNADGRVMIDLLNFARMNPDNPGLGNAMPPCDLRTGIAAPVCLKKPQDKDLMLSPAIVYGFSFRLKKWGCFEVCGLQEIMFDEGAYEVLKMRNLNQKEMLRNLVEHYVLAGGAGAATAEPNQNIDPISSKGQGCIVLCHGPPGTGKTLTAEALAETLHCPLWSVSAFELGNEPDRLEIRLSFVLEIARTWRAILLLDEADAYMEKRGVGVDVTRNLMTGVFLRLLEYHSGVLFLTTNRVKSFDEAILSRVTIAISYPPLDDEQRVKIWETLLSRAGLPGVSCQSLLYERRLNGREIRNVLHLAQVWSRRHKQSLTIDVVRKAMDSFVSGNDDILSTMDTSPSG
eukprot:c25265_g2_i4 orf=488-4081(-)